MLRTSMILSVCAALFAAAAVAIPCKRSNGTGISMPAEFAKFQTEYQKNLRAILPDEECTSENLAVRRSWDDLDDETRIDYLRAVNCLATKPALTDKSLAPGAVNRLDDFTYIHINQTNIIHQSGYLLPWHRLFLWQMEEALRNECGYKGYLPYWDNARFSENPTASKVWDGSETSFGSNGIYLENDHGPYNVILPGLVITNFTLPKPAGTGGGCITDGPFKDLQLNLGPVAKEVIDPANKFGYKYNPRCLSRNFDPESSVGTLTWANATEIVSSSTISELRNNIETLWHKNSHTFIGKEGADPFSPTNDPAFYILHAQIDRLWAIWQGQDLEQRTYAIDGNRTFLGIPLDYAPNVLPSLATIEDQMDMGLGLKPKTKEAMPMTKNGMCYIYE